MKHLVKKKYTARRPRLIINRTMQNDAANRTICEVSSTGSAEKNLNFGDFGANSLTNPIDHSSQIPLENNQNHVFQSNSQPSKTVLPRIQCGSTSSSYLNASSLISNFTRRSNDLHSFSSDGVHPGISLSDPERLEMRKLDRKLLVVLEKMERMQERINSLELKFEKMNDLIPIGTSTNNVLQPPEAVPIVTEWHKNMNHVNREHIIKTFVKAVHPWSPVADDRIRVALDSFARKVEKEYYETANSQSEYLHSAAAKYYSLRQEIADRVEKRKALQQVETAKQLKQN